MQRQAFLFAIALAALAASTLAEAQYVVRHGYWVRPYPRYFVYPYPYLYPYPYAVAPAYVVPVVPYTVYQPAPPRQPEPPQYRYGERTERSQAQIVPPPPPQRVAIEERITLSAKELFDFDSAKLKLPQPRLDEIADALKRNPQVSRVRIAGYTDRIGTISYNQKLSEIRAHAVKNYLVAKGVAGERLVAVGRGKASPVVECNDKDRAALVKCLEPNRRVEIEPITVPKT